MAATLSTILVIVIGCAAGFWQLSRADEKIRLAQIVQDKERLPELSANIQSLTLNEANQRRMRVVGQFIPEYAIWLENRPRPVDQYLAGASSGQSGFYLLMPLLLQGTAKDVVWVNRGWAPRSMEDRLKMPNIQIPIGNIEVEGLVIPHPGKVFDLSFGKTDLSLSGSVRIEQNFDLNVEAKLHDWNQLPFILRQNKLDSLDGLIREWPPLTTGVDRHYAYAFQWFSLAACGFLFWLIHGILQYRRNSQNGEE